MTADIIKLLLTAGPDAVKRQDPQYAKPEAAGAKLWLCDLLFALALPANTKQILVNSK